MSFVFRFILNFCSYGAIGTIIYILFRTIYLKLKPKKRKSKKEEILLVLFVFYFAGLLSQTILPPIGYSFDDGLTIGFNSENYIQLSKNGFVHVQNQPIYGSINLIPFKTISSYFTGEGIHNFSLSDLPHYRIVNVLGNWILFVPFGFLLPLISKKCKKISKVLLFGFLLVLLIEFEQYFIGRSCDIDDLILNVLGVAFGYLLYRLVYKLSSKKSAHVFG